jgi:heme o synthase
VSVSTASALSPPAPGLRVTLGPGPWLRLTAAAGAAGGALIIVTGLLDLAPAHRALALIALPPPVALVLGTREGPRTVRRAAALALGLLLVAIASGGVVRLSGQAPWARTAHLVAAGLACAAELGALATTLTPDRGVATASWRDYVALTKPRIMSLLLVTTVTAMVAGAGGLPGPGVLIATVVGGILASGGASAINHVLDRDIDRLMGGRTEGRPVAADRVAPERALQFGLALSALSVVLLAAAVNALAALLALAGNLLYVLVYTRWLKRTTPQNIVIGGAAGAVPPLVGWAAVTGGLGGPAWLAFAIVFLWTPPHFWALALLLERQYAAARIPMLPVVRGTRSTTRHIVAYTVALVAVSLAPAAWPRFGLAYLVAAAVLGLAFLALAARLHADPTRRRAGQLFHFSLLYLALLFVALALAAALS